MLHSVTSEGVITRKFSADGREKNDLENIELLGRNFRTISLLKWFYYLSLYKRLVSNWSPIDTGQLMINIFDKDTPH